MCVITPVLLLCRKDIPLRSHPEGGVHFFPFCLGDRKPGQLLLSPISKSICAEWVWMYEWEVGSKSVSLVEVEQWLITHTESLYGNLHVFTYIYLDLVCLTLAIIMGTRVHDPWKSAGSHVHSYFDTEQCLLGFVVQSGDEYEHNSCEDICPPQEFSLMHFP